jgi:hypothetical protein
MKNPAMITNINFVHFLVLAFVFFHITGCSKEDKIKSVAFIKFSIAGACPGSVLTSSAEKEKTIVITTQEMLSKETGCLASAPQVDFNTHFVLAGRAALTNCAELEEETIEEMDNTIKYRVQTRQRDCLPLDTVYFMAAVPIQYKDRQITFDIKNSILYGTGSLLPGKNVDRATCRLSLICFRVPSRI